MGGKGRAIGAGLIVVSVVVGAVFPYLLIALPREKAVELLIYTVAALAVAIGGLIGAVGLFLLRGFRDSEEPEATS